MGRGPSTALARFARASFAQDDIGLVFSSLIFISLVFISLILVLVFRHSQIAVMLRGAGAFAKRVLWRSRSTPTPGTMLLIFLHAGQERRGRLSSSETATNHAAEQWVGVLRLRLPALCAGKLRSG